MDLSIIIPCYNEVDNVPKLTGELLPVVLGLASDCCVELVFVDDGSRDQTWAALGRAFGQSAHASVKCRLLRHEVNRGLGAALRTGFGAATGDVVVTTDSDGTYRFAKIPALLSYLSPDVDIVVASPYHPDGDVVGVPAYRLLLSQGCSFIYRILVNPRVYTYTSLFRAYRCEVLRSVSFSSDGFLAGTELLVKAMLSGFRAVEFPAQLHRREFGESKAKLLRTVLAHLRFQARVVGHRLGIQPVSSRPSAASRAPERATPSD